jgi:tol-pal system protein YbgF
MKNTKIRWSLVALSILVCMLSMAPGCFSGRQFSNWSWQLDSLRYYTSKFDSVLALQTEVTSQLHVDLYTKMDELNEKLEMINSRLSDTESQLTRIQAKIGSAQYQPTDSTQTEINPEAQSIYDAAYLNYVKGHYNEAIKGFQSYLDVQPDSPLSDNAYYWIGESYDALGKRQDAVNTFQQLITIFPGSNRIPTALYKMGIIYEESGDKKTATTYYNKLIRDYPKSPEASIAKDRLNL